MRDTVVLCVSTGGFIVGVTVGFVGGRGFTRGFTVGFGDYSARLLTVRRLKRKRKENQHILLGRVSPKNKIAPIIMFMFC